MCLEDMSDAGRTRAMRCDRDMTCTLCFFAFDDGFSSAASDDRQTGRAAKRLLKHQEPMPLKADAAVGKFDAGTDIQ